MEPNVIVGVTQGVGQISDRSLWHPNPMESLDRLEGQWRSLFSQHHGRIPKPHFRILSKDHDVAGGRLGLRSSVDCRAVDLDGLLHAVQINVSHDPQLEFASINDLREIQFFG